jgi:hypothetical protein
MAEALAEAAITSESIRAWLNTFSILGNSNQRGIWTHMDNELRVVSISNREDSLSNP